MLPAQWASGLNQCLVAGVEFWLLRSATHLPVPHFLALALQTGCTLVASKWCVVVATPEVCAVTSLATTLLELINNLGGGGGGGLGGGGGCGCGLRGGRGCGCGCRCRRLQALQQAAARHTVPAFVNTVSCIMRWWLLPQGVHLPHIATVT
jgi:hypothetical protein